MYYGEAGRKVADQTDSTLTVQALLRHNELCRRNQNVHSKNQNVFITDEVTVLNKTTSILRNYRTHSRVDFAK